MCGEAGCTSYGFSIADHCLDCRFAQENGNCVANCSAFHYPDNSKLCQLCHSECAVGCTGPNPTIQHCVRCKHFQHGNDCVPVCPNNTYPDVDNVCQPCDANCIGCTGPRPDQCLQCRAAKDQTNCVAECPASKYEDHANLCQNCNSLCNLTVGCTGPSAGECKACANVLYFHAQQGPVCVSQCTGRNYTAFELYNGMSDTRVCRECNVECADACRGPTNADCIGSCARFTFGSTCVTFLLFV